MRGMSRPVIQVSALTKRFGETLAVDGIDFVVPQGATAALLGGNGAGKTTTLSMLLGLLVFLAAYEMFGVGAAFDIHTGRIKDAPYWMKVTGVQWMHRIYQDPARLWRRYLVNNPKFVYRIALELLGIAKQETA